MNTKGLLTGVGAGAALAYLFDPAAGSGRRARARDKMAWATHRTRDGLGAAAKDLANRTKGMAAATRSRLSSGEVDDGRLADRVRSRLGRVSTHPRAIEVDAHDGVVVLRGPILAREVDSVVETVEGVRGVRSVTNALEVYEAAGSVPSLQGEGRTAGEGAGWIGRTLMLGGLAAAGAIVGRQVRHRADDHESAAPRPRPPRRSWRSFPHHQSAQIAEARYQASTDDRC
jgi:osmotically-inducible protein OsmY